MTSSSLDLSSSFLPSKLPDGDPSDFALPVFLAQPRSTYASKEVNGVLTCRVAHAKMVYFTCDGEKMKSVNETDGVDVATKSKYKEITISIRKSQVLDTLQEFSCRCRASSAQGEVESDPALVEIACKYHNCFEGIKPITFISISGG